jgi:hypothetical protein
MRSWPFVSCTPPSVWMPNIECLLIAPRPFIAAGAATASRNRTWRLPRSPCDTQSPGQLPRAERPDMRLPKFRSDQLAVVLIVGLLLIGLAVWRSVTLYG